MPDLGERANVMGPQPRAARSSVPPDLLEAANHVLDLLASGDFGALAALATPAAAGELDHLARAIKPGNYSRYQIIATARLNYHYYIKARLFGDRAEPITVQYRLGRQDGRWMIWEAMDLSGGKTAWTR
jgi:hypothetical protein